MLRRTFIQLLAVIINGAAGAAIAIPGLRFLLEPLVKSSRQRSFIRVAPLSAIPADEPYRATVRAARDDAWMHHPPGPIGSVWLTRPGTDEDAPADPPKLRCLQTICPHLGCRIEYAAGREVFTCPCHASDFSLTGQRLNGPSPRDMDKLACRVTEPDADGTRWVEVEYVEFKTGTPTQEPLA